MKIKFEFEPNWIYVTPNFCWNRKYREILIGWIFWDLLITY